MEQKNILFIGAGGDIGNALVSQLRAAGHTLTTTRSHMDDSDALVLDLSSQDSIEHFAAQIQGQEFDLVMLNSGISDVGQFLGRSAEELEKEVRINLLGPMQVLSKLQSNLTSEALIVLNSSLNAFMFTPYMTAYCATKAGLLAFGEALRHELASHGLRVATLVTPPVHTKMALRTQQEISHFTAKPLEQKLLDPDDFARWTLKQIEHGKPGLWIHKNIRGLLRINRFLPSLQSSIYRKMFL